MIDWFKTWTEVYFLWVCREKFLCTFANVIKYYDNILIFHFEFWNWIYKTTITHWSNIKKAANIIYAYILIVMAPSVRCKIPIITLSAVLCCALVRWNIGGNIYIRGLLQSFIEVPKYLIAIGMSSQNHPIIFIFFI